MILFYLSEGMLSVEMTRDIEKYANDYAQGELRFEKEKQYRRQRQIIGLLENDNNKRYLEIGCGMDPLYFHVDKPLWTVVEPSLRFIDLVKPKSNSNVTLISGFFEDVFNQLPYEYDAIICSGLLHEVSNPHRLLETIVKVCERKTYVYLSVPNARSFHRLLGKEMGMIADIHEFTDANIVAQQNTVFDSESFKKLIVECGLKIETFWTWFIKPFSHRQMSEMQENGIIDEKVLDALENMTRYIPDLGSEMFAKCKLV